jgi:hypothetical protein
MNDNNAVIKIGADVDGALRGLDQVKTSFADVASRIALPITLGGIAAFVTSTLSAVAALDDMAERTGASVENLSALQRVAKIGGHDMGVFEQAMIKLNKGLAGTDEESGKVAGALRAIGLSVEDLKGKDPARNMLSIALAMDQFQDGAGKSAIAMDLFGKSGAQALPAIKDLAEVGELNGKVTAQQAAQAEEFEKSLKRLQAQSQIVTKSLALEMLPALADIAKELSSVNSNGDSLSKVFGTGLVEVLKTVTVLGGNVGYVINGIGTEIGGMAAQISAFVSGDFQKAAQIGALMKEDAAKARADIDAWSEKILKAGTTPGSLSAAAEKRSLGSYSTEGKGAAARTPATKESGPKLSSGEAGLLDEWSSKVIQADIADAVAAAQERVEAVSSIARVARDMRLAKLDADLMTEKEREQLQFAERMAFLASAQASEAAQYADNLEAKAAIDEQYKARREELELQHQAKLGDISAQAVLQRRQFEQMTLAAQTSAVAGMLTAHLGAVANKNRAFFYAHKLGSIAQATISTYEGANKALAMGPIIGPPLAAMIVAAGLANVAQIKAQNFSGGGAGGSLPAYTSGQVGRDFIGSRIAEPPMPVTQAKAEAPKKQVHVTLVGDGFTYKDVAEKLIPLINEAVGNGIDITVGRG